jgi:hypothetical protein
MNVDFDNLIPDFDYSGNLTDPSLQTTLEDNPEPEVIEDDIEDNIDEPDDSIVTPTPDPEPEADEVATLFFNKLVEEGIAEKPEDKDSFSWEDVNNNIAKYKEDLPKEITSHLIESVPDVGKDLIDYVFTKRENLTKEDLKTFFDAYLDDIKEISISDESNAREFLSAKYKEQGLRDSQIEVMLDVLEEEDALMEEASKYNKPGNKAKNILNQEKAQINEREQKIQELFSNVNTTLENLNWKPERTNIVKDYLVTGKANQVLSKAATSAEALVQLADLATYYDEKTGKFDLETYIKQYSSKEAINLKNKINKDMLNANRTKEKIQSNKADKFKDLVPVSPLNNNY